MTHTKANIENAYIHAHGYTYCINPSFTSRQCTISAVPFSFPFYVLQKIFISYIIRGIVYGEF